ncbi:MAG: hypothetical protein C4521_05060 [Actinobacteria bacterium]|nr:MAG: hypothetical protein C4521_05060 [Actinomycetota bacterium]
MDLAAYILERNKIIVLATPVTLVLALLSLLVLGAALLPQARRYLPYLLVSLTGTLLAGFVILAFYHLRIYETVALPNPATGLAAGRFKIPLWIEDEKLYFQALLVGLFALAIARRRDGLSAAVGGLAGGLGLATALVSNPFAAPLPDLHETLLRTSAGMASPSPAQQMQAFGAAFSQMQYFYNSAYMWIHPPLLFVSYAAFAVSFVACIFMLLGKVKEHEKTAYDSAKLGYLALTFGILVGYPWAIAAWKDSPWWWAPKINMALMLWFAYTGYLHSRLYLTRRGMWKTTAILGIACFAALVLTYLTTYVVPGTHSVA